MFVGTINAGRFIVDKSHSEPAPHTITRLTFEADRNTAGENSVYRLRYQFVQRLGRGKELDEQRRAGELVRERNVAHPLNPIELNALKLFLNRLWVQFFYLRS